MSDQTTPLGAIIDASTNQPVPLAMQHLNLSGRASPVGALLRATHRFKAEGDKPIEALYTFGLPKNGVVRRFIVKGKDFEVESALKPRAEARKEYEDGVQAGHLSVLGETSLDGVVTLSVGQIKPDEEITVVIEALVGVEVRDRGFRFRFPFTLPPRYHSKAQMTQTPTGGKIDPPEDVFGDLILPEWRTDIENLHAVSFNMHVESGGVLESVASPSHRVKFNMNADGSADVELAGGDTAPNRDLVIDVNVREATALVFADESVLGKGTGDKALPKDAPRWTAIIPSSVLPKASGLTRKVCFVLDQSGSMEGPKMKQSKAVLAACLSALGPEDYFALMSFDHGQYPFHSGLVQATDVTRRAALQWLASIHASGSTELAPALGMAVRLLGGPGHDIFLITDGEVSETGPVIETMAASGTRVHCLGVGEASEDRFLSSLSRRTQGVSKMVGSSENVSVLGLELFNAMKQPVQTEVKATVGTGKKSQDHRVGTVYENRAIVLTDNGTSGKGLPTEAVLHYAGGQITVALKGLYRATPDGLSALLWAGRQVEDLEAALDMTKDGAGRTTVEDSLKAVSIAYGLASRVMSLSAVVKRVGDQPGVTPEQKVIPVGMPEDMKDGAGVFGSRGFGGMVAFRRVASGPVAAVSYLSGGGGTKGYGGGSSHMFSLCATTRGRGVTLGDCSVDSLCEESMPVAAAIDPALDAYLKASSRATAFTTSSAIVELGTLAADGGLPGQTTEARVLKTAVLALAVLNLCVEGGTSMFTAHLRRMADFLDAHKDVAPDVLPGLVAKFKAASAIVPGGWGEQYNLLSLPVLGSPDETKKVWDAIRAAA